MGWLVLAVLPFAFLSSCGSAQPTASAYPGWLSELIRSLETEPVANPPASIYRYEYDGQAVYYLPPRCCDVPSNLYDTEGNIICHPDGGEMGVGDGRCPDFFDKRENEALVWQDKRTYP
jgi:hypothetical protein